ncbi:MULTISPECIES: TetR/AcrR family transcriptional regulator C-terminal domain-containing protein [Ensifer]|uniref:TetR/AcrR family transcriptional regulator C-terminal domain-containing protein n=1 Tax=Ensifer sp. Root142 TaxID=1736461 RepID=UPI000AA3B5BB|nr:MULTISPECIES: TetR/AcrR family transcriptional regulator C-terminal domain-containing protein [Ensifer]
MLSHAHFRLALLAYRDGARIHAGTRPSAPQLGAAEAQLRSCATPASRPAMRPMP